MNDAPQTDVPQDGGSTAQNGPGAPSPAGTGVPPHADPVKAPGRTEIVVGAAFVGGLILGKLVKRRDK